MLLGSVETLHLISPADVIVNGKLSFMAAPGVDSRTSGAHLTIPFAAADESNGLRGTHQ